MSETITDRQKRILKAVIRGFMKSAEPVGSSNVVSEQNIDVSSATVRNEMVALSDAGYLTKTHSSSGRLPTDLGLRYFVQQLMKERELEKMKKVNVKLELFNSRFDQEELLEKVLELLVSETGCVSLVMLGDSLRSKGLSKLTKYGEFRDIEVIETLLQVLESRSMFEKIFSKRANDDICILIGEECEVGGMDECAVVFTSFDYVGNNKGFVGVLGPRRLKYAKVIPVIRYVGGVISEAVKGW